MNAILPLLFYATGSVCFLIGSLLSIVRAVR